MAGNRVCTCTHPHTLLRHLCASPWDEDSFSTLSQAASHQFLPCLLWAEDGPSSAMSSRVTLTGSAMEQVGVSCASKANRAAPISAFDKMQNGDDCRAA